jgi:8-oxo-dGTP pyrophosphatase MutT (NUDIX family)
VPDDGRHPLQRDVAVAALLKENKVLLVRTRRLPEAWQPVGGGVEPDDDSPRDAAARELREELGLDLPLDALSPRLARPYDFGQGQVYFFVARLPETAELAPNGEIVEMCWAEVSDARNLQSYPATSDFLESLSEELAAPASGDALASDARSTSRR